MPLEDPTTIDMVLANDSGGLEFVITDSGAVEAPGERRALLQAKLLAYYGYITSAAFESDYPDADRGSSRIKVLHLGTFDAAEGWPGMVSAPGGTGITIPVVYELFEGL
jgi:hypothetical protein